MLKDGWERLNRTLELLPGLNTRKVIRLTLVKGLNMHSSEKYAELIKKSGVHMIEAKAYMALGFSRERLGPQAMPTHKEIQKFSEELSKHLNMPIIDEQESSRVVLISDWTKEQLKLKLS